jgi:hypothetical protein
MRLYPPLIPASRSPAMFPGSKYAIDIKKPGPTKDKKVLKLNLNGLNLYLSSPASISKLLMDPIKFQKIALNY